MQTVTPNPEILTQSLAIAVAEQDSQLPPGTTSQEDRNRYGKSLSESLRIQLGKCGDDDSLATAIAVSSVFSLYKPDESGILVTRGEPAELLAKDQAERITEAINWWTEPFRGSDTGYIVWTERTPDQSLATAHRVDDESFFGSAIHIRTPGFSGGPADIKVRLPGANSVRVGRGRGLDGLAFDSSTARKSMRTYDITSGGVVVPVDNRFGPDRVLDFIAPKSADTRFASNGEGFEFRGDSLHFVTRTALHRAGALSEFYDQYPLDPKATYRQNAVSWLANDLAATVLGERVTGRPRGEDPFSEYPGELSVNQVKSILKGLEAGVDALREVLDPTQLQDDDAGIGEMARYAEAWPLLEVILERVDS